MVARVGIEPTTRGFSVRRRARFGAGKLKTGDGFPPDRPNGAARPSLSRAGTPKFRPNARGPDPVQRLTDIATELFPNRARRQRHFDFRGTDWSASTRFRTRSIC
jgi:hypothetical protein